MEGRVAADTGGRAAAGSQRQDRALADLRKIETQPYDELEDFHRAALESADLDG